MLLYKAKFAYNNTIYTTIKVSLYKALYKYNLCIVKYISNFIGKV